MLAATRKRMSVMHARRGVHLDLVIPFSSRWGGREVGQVEVSSRIVVGLVLEVEVHGFIEGLRKAREKRRRGRIGARTICCSV